ncbi:MAG TPA: polysaccharide deacetylase family protein [Candidatus Krumholzibacteria bacterium]|nr:polysaccharide deacetylase family protein [Candidatus Krumholzibacteria bacterium]
MIGQRGTKLRRLARRAVQRLAPGSMILLYHRIAEARADPWSLCVRPHHFAEHLEVLCGRIAPLTEICENASSARTGGRFALTFDDGYADTLHTALPLLERHEAPATVFVATGGVDDGRPFWWDELVALTEAQEPSVQRELQALLGDLDRVSRQEHLVALRVEAGVEVSASTPARALNRAEIVRLATGGLVEIGAHTVSHPKLPALAPAAQEREIRDSRDFLAAIIGRPITSFAYPHGRHDATTRRIVHEAGFRRACTSHGGTVRRCTDPLRLPRLEVPDCDGDTFARILRRLGF